MTTCVIITNYSNPLRLSFPHCKRRTQYLPLCFDMTMDAMMRAGGHFCDICSSGKVFPFQNQNFQVGTKNTRNVIPTSCCPSCSSSDICSGERSGKVLYEEHLSAALKIGKGMPGSCLSEKILLCLTWLVSFGHESHLSPCSSCW